MIDLETYVYNGLANVLRTAYGSSNIYITGESTQTPVKFPCVMIEESDSMTDGMDSSNHETESRHLFEIRVYSALQSGQKAQCRGICKTINDYMTLIGFQRTSQNQVTNYADESICQYILRYSAILSNNEICRG